MKNFISNTITIAVLLTLFISCKDTDQELKKEKLNAPEVTYIQLSENSAELKWDPVTGAESYSFEQQNGIEITSKKTSLLLNDLVPGINTMRCKSNAGDSDKYQDSDWSEFDIEITKQEKKPLPAPELSYEKTGSFDVRVYWPSVPESVGYAYSLNGDPEEMVYDINEIILEDLDPRGYVLLVKALAGDSEDYSDSPWAEINFTLESVKLPTPELQYSLDGNKVTFFWEPVPNADSYVLMIASDFHYTEDSFYEISLPAGEHSASIKALSDNSQKYRDSDFITVTVTIDYYEARYEDYLGSWELIPERMLIYDIIDPESGHTIVDYGTPLTVNIEEGDLEFNGEHLASYVITGMSQFTYGEDNIPVPFYATFNRYSNNDWTAIEEGCLEILQGVGIDHASLPDFPNVKMIFSPVGLGYIDGDESTITYMRGQYPIITFRMTSPNTAEVKTTTTTLTDGGSFEVVAVEAFIMSAYGSDYEYAIYGAYPDLPAGGYYACPYKARKLDVSLSPAIRDASVMTTSQVLSNISATFKPERNIPQVLSGSPIILNK